MCVIGGDTIGDSTLRRGDTMCVTRCCHRVSAVTALPPSAASVALRCPTKVAQEFRHAPLCGGAAGVHARGCDDFGDRDLAAAFEVARYRLAPLVIDPQPGLQLSSNCPDVGTILGRLVIVVRVIAAQLALDGRAFCRSFLWMFGCPLLIGRDF